MPIQYLFQILLLILQGGRSRLSWDNVRFSGRWQCCWSHFECKPISTQPSNIPSASTSRKLQKKLMRLLHDDRDTANRLISQVKMKKSNKSSMLKVIYDLERDRGLELRLFSPASEVS